MTLHVYIDYQRANLAKLGTSSLWRYWRSFKLVGLPYLSLLMLSFRILAFYLLSTDFHLQGSPNPNLTKAQLVDAVQQHFASQVSLLPSYPTYPISIPMSNAFSAVGSRNNLERWEDSHLIDAENASVTKKLNSSLSSAYAHCTRFRNWFLPFNLCFVGSKLTNSKWFRNLFMQQRDRNQLKRTENDQEIGCLVGRRSNVIYAC